MRFIGVASTKHILNICISIRYDKNIMIRSTCKPKQKLSLSHTHTHKHTHTNTNTHTHAYIHTHTHTLTTMKILILLLTWGMLLYNYFQILHFIHIGLFWDVNKDEAQQFICVEITKWIHISFVLVKSICIYTSMYS